MPFETINELPERKLQKRNALKEREISDQPSK